MIKAIVFDWGGVLIDETLGGLDDYCASVLGVDVDPYNSVRQEYLDDFARGLITEDEFWQKICDKLHVDVPETDSLWGDAVESIFTEKKEMFALIEELKKDGYKIGFLSNIEMPAVEYWKKNDYEKYFDAVVFSCIEHIAKPDKEIYQMICARLRVLPEESVFIDDKIELVESAKNIGMEGIIFGAVKQTKRELKSLLDNN